MLRFKSSVELLKLCFGNKISRIKSHTKLRHETIFYCHYMRTDNRHIKLMKCACPCSRQCASIGVSADAVPCFQIGTLTLYLIS